VKGTMLNDNILIKVKEVEEKVNGIFLPDSSKEKPHEGEVILVGTGKTDSNGEPIDMQVKIGDIVIFEKYSEKSIKIENEEYVIVNQDSVLFIK